MKKNILLETVTNNIALISVLRLSLILKNRTNIQYLLPGRRLCAFLILSVLILNFSVVTKASANDVTVINNQFRISFEQMTLPQNEAMGLLGFNYLLKPTRPFYFGLGIYGAVTGDRGGFFTGGLEAGLQYELLNNWIIDVGGFAGGGGGGAAPQGGGAMLRPHIDLYYKKNRYAVGLSYNQVNFPNGNIQSEQFGLVLETEFDTFLLPGHFSNSGGSADIRASQISQANRTDRLFSPQLTFYHPRGSRKGRGDIIHDRAINVIGIRWRQRTGSVLWNEFETGGSWGGGTDGFAQVLFGKGLRFPLITRSYLVSGAMLGAAGGGNVDTGGGVIVRAYAGIQYFLSKRWMLGLESGWTQAIDGEFAALTSVINIGYQYQVLFPNAGSGDSYTVNNWARYRIRSGIQRYSHYQDNGRKDAALPGLDIDQTALKIDYFLSHNVFVSGQALAAYRGDVGGYAVGLVGVGFEQRLAQNNALNIGLELLVGAAGGGGVAVGDGSIVQPMLNFNALLKKHYYVGLGVGYIYAPTGDFRALVSDINVEYRFSVPHG